MSNRNYRTPTSEREAACPVTQVVAWQTFHAGWVWFVQVTPESRTGSHYTRSVQENHKDKMLLFCGWNFYKGTHNCVGHLPEKAAHAGELRKILVFSAPGLRMVSPASMQCTKGPSNRRSPGPSGLPGSVWGIGKKRGEEQSKTTRYPCLVSSFFCGTCCIKCLCFQLKLNLTKLWLKVISVC